MSGGTRFCWRCDEPILAGQPVVTGVKVSISGGGATFVRHWDCPGPGGGTFGSRPARCARRGRRNRGPSALVRDVPLSDPGRRELRDADLGPRTGLSLPMPGAGARERGPGDSRATQTGATRRFAALTQVESFLRPSAVVGRVGLEPTADGL